MSWIIQSPSTIYKNRSMYFEKLVEEDGLPVALFTHQIEKAKEFEKEDAKNLIKENQLDHCHLIPS